MPARSAKHAVVGREKHIYDPLFGTCQVERVELAEPEPLKRLGANRSFGPRDDDFVRKREKRKNVVPPFQVRVAANFDFEHATTHPCSPAHLHESKNALDRFRLFTYA